MLSTIISQVSLPHSRRMIFKHLQLPSAYLIKAPMLSSCLASMIASSQTKNYRITQDSLVYLTMRGLLVIGTCTTLMDMIKTTLRPCQCRAGHLPRTQALLPSILVTADPIQLHQSTIKYTHLMISYYLTLTGSTGSHWLITLHSFIILIDPR